MTEKEIQKEIRELRKEASQLSEVIACSWNSTPEERMIEIVKKLAAIASKIDELRSQLP
jgi:uncharacterized coiled-coil DUF342 family protein